MFPFAGGGLRRAYVSRLSRSLCVPASFTGGGLRRAYVSRLTRYPSPLRCVSVVCGGGGLRRAYVSRLSRQSVLLLAARKSAYRPPKRMRPGKEPTVDLSTCPTHLDAHRQVKGGAASRLRCCSQLQPRLCLKQATPSGSFASLLHTAVCIVLPPSPEAIGT